VNILEILAVVAIVVYVIVRQVLGEPIRAKRLIILPGVLTLIGVLDLTKHTVHATTTDILLIAIGAAVAGAIGFTQGRIMRLEQRNGYLWGQLPRRGLWLWLLLYASRGLFIGVAYAVGAHVAAGVQSELLVLGINRLGQAAIVSWRAQSAGIPFAPEKDGRASAPPAPASAQEVDRPNHSQDPSYVETSPDTSSTGWAGFLRQIGVIGTELASSRSQRRNSRRRSR
jgi:hypothetical protein